jgi:hypothetical protein
MLDAEQLVAQAPQLHGIEHLAGLKRRHQKMLVAGEAAQVGGQAVRGRLGNDEALHRTDA